MAYLDAAEAAKKLGRTERTVRQWIKDGDLPATHPTHGRKNKFLIREEDVDALAKELTEAGDTKRKASEDTLPEIAELRTYIEHIEQEHSKRIATLEQAVQSLQQQRTTIDEKADRTDRDTSDTIPSQISIVEPNKATVEKKSAGRPKGVKAKSEPPVPGAIRLVDFAKDHGISYDTIRGHAKYGIGTNKEKLPIFSRPVPGREKTEEQEYWVLPGQEDAVFDYGRRYSTPYAPLPDGYVPFFEFVDRHKVGRNEARKNSLIRVEKGKWLDKGKEITEVLSPSAQRAVWEQFHAIEPKFDSCQQCPHAL